MAKIDAVIAALQAILKEAEGRPTPSRWKTRAVNRWINQLPGAWIWRWRHLKLRGDLDRLVSREEFISHVRATLAYLETNRDEIQPIRLRRWLPTLRRRQSSVSPTSNKRLLH
jgi:hypothetical protein